MTREEERVWIRSDRAIARACAERGGPILNHMSTANVARDLDLLRRAVGDAKLTHAGYSYATAQALQASGASSKSALIPPMLRRMLTD